MAEKNCIICGKTYQCTRGNRLCCSPACKAERRKITSREYIQRAKEEAKRDKKASKNSLVSVAVAAREAGMTYGQYVARMEGRSEQADN